MCDLRLVFLLLLLATQSSAFGQQADTLIKKLDSLNKKADTTGQVNNIQPEAYNQRTQITFKNYFVLLTSDFKQQISAPFTIGKNDWVKVAKYGVVLGGLFAVDKPVQQQAVKWRKDNPFLTNSSRYITNTGGMYEALVLGAIGTYGYAFKKEKMKTTTLLASQAYLTSIVLNTAIKKLAGRHRPSVYNQDQVDADPFVFKGPFSNSGKDADGKKLAASFPSAHATLGFAAATVYAMEYRDQPIIPILSYSAATLISLSRITENAHWTSDVVTGALIGYLTGRQVVNNYHRYAKVKTTPKPASKRSKKSNISLNMRNIGGETNPVLTFTLRP